jgi:H+/gluconate symporter-like permease
MQTSTPSNPEHLTQREKRRLALCAGAGFFLSPGAWLLQVMISETVSAQGCDAVTTPLKTTGVSHMHAWLYAVSAVAMLISFVCAAAAVYGYVLVARKERRLKASRNAGDSQEQSSREREQLGRKRFIALCSVLIGCGFVVGLMFTILAEVFLVSCSQWH